MKFIKIISFLLLCTIISSCKPQQTIIEETPPHRIICASPVMTEIIFALGCGDRIVGISEYTTYPKEALELPVIGTAITPNKERLLTLEPDIIIGQGKQATLVNYCKLYKIRCISLDMDNMNDVYTSIQIIADILQESECGKKLVKNIQQQISDIKSQIENSPARKVLFLFGRQPGDLTGLTTIGPGSFLDELITVAGGSNIFHDAKGPYPQISKESLVMRAPEIIMELHPAGISKKNSEKLYSDWSRLPPMPATKNGNIYYMTNNYLLIPGPRMGMTVKRFAKTIHPEAFNE